MCLNRQKMTARSFKTLGNVHESCKSCISIGHSHQPHPLSMPCSLLCACMPKLLAFCSDSCSEGTKAAAWTCARRVCALKSSSWQEDCFGGLHSLKDEQTKIVQVPSQAMTVEETCFVSLSMGYAESFSGHYIHVMTNDFKQSLCILVLQATPLDRKGLGAVWQCVLYYMYVAHTVCF